MNLLEFVFSDNKKCLIAYNPKKDMSIIQDNISQKLNSEFVDGILECDPGKLLNVCNVEIKVYENIQLMFTEQEFTRYINGEVSVELIQTYIFFADVGSLEKIFETLHVKGKLELANKYPEAGKLLMGCELFSNILFYGEMFYSKDILNLSKILLELGQNEKRVYIVEYDSLTREHDILVYMKDTSGKMVLGNRAEFKINVEAINNQKGSMNTSDVVVKVMDDAINFAIHESFVKITTGNEHCCYYTEFLGSYHTLASCKHLLVDNVEILNNVSNRENLDIRLGTGKTGTFTYLIRDLLHEPNKILFIVV